MEISDLKKKKAKISSSCPFSLRFFVKVFKFCSHLKNREIIQMTAAPRVCLATVFMYVVCELQKPCGKIPRLLPKDLSEHLAASEKDGR